MLKYVKNFIIIHVNFRWPQKQCWDVGS